MRNKIGGFLALFLLLLANLSFTQSIRPGDAFGGNELYEGYSGVALGQPTPTEHPKDVKPLTFGKEYRILTIVITELGQAPLITSQQVNTLLNAERKPRETALQFKNRMPFGAWTSLRQYFLDQSNGKFSISSTVIDYEPSTASMHLSYYNDDSQRLEAFLSATADFGSLKNSFEGVNFIHATHGYIGDFTYTDLETGKKVTLAAHPHTEAYGAGADEWDRADLANNPNSATYTYNLPVQIHRATEAGLMLRDICIATAYSICKLPPLYGSPKYSLLTGSGKGNTSKINVAETNMAGFCLMGGLVPSVAANVRFEDHPPSINTYYKIKLGWVDAIMLDQQSKQRTGTQHEGRVAFVYKPDTSANRYKNTDEYFIMETRQNRNYEMGTVLGDDLVTRGIFPGDKEGDPKDSVNPAEGLVVYHVDEENYQPGSPPDDLFHIGVVDATWGPRSSARSSYPRAAPARAPWRFEKNAAFRRAEFILEDVGLAITGIIGRNKVTNLPIYKRDKENGGGCYDEDGYINPPGGCDEDGDFMSLRDAFNDYYSDRTSYTWDEFIDFSTKNPSLHYYLYERIKFWAKFNDDPITQFGQYTKRGEFSPSGEYIFAELEKQQNPGRYFDEDGHTDEAIMLAPDGNGYINKNGYYTPGGGYEPIEYNEYKYDEKGNLIRKDPDDDTSPPVTNDYYEFIPKAGGKGRNIYESNNNDLNEVKKDLGGFYNFGLGYKDLIHQLTNPALEFWDWSYKAKNSSATSICTHAPDIHVPFSVTNEMTPVFSNISPVDETMTTEVCNYEYYFNPSPDHDMHKVNGFLGKKFQNELGVSLKPDKILSTDPRYAGYKNGLYDSYTVDMVINYLDAPTNMKIGIWNRGGQKLPYEIDMSHTDYTTLVNTTDGLVTAGIMTDRSETLEFAFNFEQISKQKAGEEFPWRIKFPFCKIYWNKEGGRSDGRKGSADLFINLTIKSPPRIIAAANVDFNKFIMKPEMDTTNVPGIEGTMQVSAPQYAQKTYEDMWLFNVGGSTLRYKLLGNREWFSDTPKTDLNESLEQWLGGYGFTNYRVRLAVKDLIEAGARERVINGEIRVYSDNLDVVGSAPLPDPKTGKTPSAPYGQKINVRASVTRELPPATELRIVNDRVVDDIYDDNDNWLNYYITDEDIKKAFAKGLENIEVGSPIAYPVFKKLPDITHYLLYVSTERRQNGPLPGDLYDIIPADNFSLTEYILLPESDQTYYVWVRTVGINDESIDLSLRLYNYDEDERLNWLAAVRGSKRNYYGGKVNSSSNSYSSIYSFYYRNRYADWAYYYHGAYPLHQVMKSEVGELSQTLSLPSVSTDIDRYYTYLKQLMAMNEEIQVSEPFELLDIYEAATPLVDNDSNLTYSLKDSEFADRLHSIGDSYVNAERDLVKLFDTYATYAANMGNEELTTAEIITAVNRFDGDLDGVINGHQKEEYEEWNQLLGTTLQSNEELNIKAQNANLTALKLELLIDNPQYNNIYNDTYKDYGIKDVYLHYAGQSFYLDSSGNRKTKKGAIQIDSNEIFQEWATYKRNAVTIWRNSDSIFISDEYSNRCSITRTEIGPPLSVSASDNITSYVQVKWNFAMPGNYYDVENFEVWRSPTRNFGEAVRIDDDNIEKLNTITGFTTNISSSYFSDYDPDNLSLVTFGLKDYTAKPYPKKYFYFVITIDRNGDRSEPSSSVSGGLARFIDELFPIVDDSDDNDGDFFDSSRGNVEVARRSSGSDDMAVRLSKASSKTRSSRSTTHDTSRYDASITKYVDLSGIDKGEVIMSFEYKFGTAAEKGYVTAIANGQELFVAFANRVGDGWHETGYIDLSSFAGQMVKLEIGLVCDSLNPSQSLWLDNLYIAGKRFSPCWELFSSPVTDSLSDVLNIDYSSDTAIYSWNNESSQYDKKSANGFNAMAGEGYWIYVSEPMKNGDVNTSSSMNSTIASPLANVELGWNLSGPVNDLYLKDRRDIDKPSSKMNYLNDYPNLCTLENYTNADGESFTRYELKAQIWAWDSNTGKYRQVKDKLEAGNAYWIFNY